MDIALEQTTEEFKITSAIQSPAVGFLYSLSSGHPDSDSTPSSSVTQLRRDTTTNEPIISSETLQRAIHGITGAGISLPQIHHAQLLLYPVRTMRGVFAWTTTQRNLARLLDSLSGTTIAKHFPLSNRDSLFTDDGAALVNPNSRCVDHGKVNFEEYSFKSKPEALLAKVGQWISQHALPQTNAFDWWRKKLAKDLIILSDLDFADLLATTLDLYITDSSEQDSLKRRRYIEFLPSDCLFYCLIGTPADFEKEHESAEDRTGPGMQAIHAIQLGLDRHLGKGFFSLTVLNADAPLQTIDVSSSSKPTAPTEVTAAAITDDGNSSPEEDKSNEH